MRKEFVLVNIFDHTVTKDRKGQPIIRLGSKPYETPKGYPHTKGYQWETIESVVVDRAHRGAPRYAVLDSQKAAVTKFIAPQENKN